MTETPQPTKKTPTKPPPKSRTGASQGEPRTSAASSLNRPHQVGKFAEFDIDKNDHECVILWENQERTSGMRCYHYLNEISEEDRATILRLQEENDMPELPFFSGLDPVVDQAYLTFMNGRVANGPFANWEAVRDQLQAEGYTIYYSDKLLESRGWSQ